jgi:hypothetical protein
LYQGQLENLKAKIWEFSTQFEERPSKKNDLELIKKLQRLVGLKNKEIQTMSHQSEFFRLELVNRENNFNKMFKKAPQIGVLNPLKVSHKEAKTHSRKKTPFREISK